MHHDASRCILLHTWTCLFNRSFRRSWCIVSSGCFHLSCGVWYTPLPRLQQSAWFSWQPLCSFVSMDLLTRTPSFLKNVKVSLRAIVLGGKFAQRSPEIDTQKNSSGHAQARLVIDLELFVFSRALWFYNVLHPTLHLATISTLACSNHFNSSYQIDPQLFWQSWPWLTLM